MTKFVFLFTLFAVFHSEAHCQNLTQENGVYSYQKVLEFEEKDSTELHGLLVNWFEETKEYAVSVEAGDSKKISADITKNNTSFYGKDYSKLKFACKISIKDNKIKLVINHMLIADVSGKTVSVSETLYSSRKGKEKTNRKAVQMKEDLTNYVEEFLDKTSSYISHDGVLEKDRW